MKNPPDEDVIQLGQVRAERSDDARDWSPRDALVSTLAAIDNGTISPDRLIVVFAQPDGGLMKMNFRAATPDRHSTMGLLLDALGDLMNN